VLDTMKKLMLALVGTSLLGTTAMGQSLSERMSHVAQQRARTQARSNSKAHMLSTMLYSDLTVTFNETPVRDAFNYLQTVLNVNIIPRFSTDRVGHGIDPETPITLDAQGEPALSVLEIILDQCQGAAFDEECTWQLRNGFIEVGTKERLNAAREIRYYNQGNQGGGGGGFGGGGGGGGFGGGGGGGFGGGGGGGGGGSGSGGSIFGDPEDEDPRITEAELAQELIDIITESVEPEAWEIAGGDAASIRYYQGVLIVRAPDYVQRQLAGYPFAIRPPAAANFSRQTRYVTFSGQMSNVTNSGFRETDAREFTGTAGGGGP
jgi:hypothetical protein